MNAHHEIRTGRVYDAPEPDDGRRVLVDRLWPRGIRKTDPRIDEWLRDVAPSTELRKWYGHKPELFDEFTHRYERELTGPDEVVALTRLRELVADGTITLVTATRDVGLSHLDTLASAVRTSESTD